MKAYIEAQGSLLLMKILETKKWAKKPVTKRGRIKSFSPKSRNRLLRFMARIRQKDVRATFITLTFKGYPTNAQAKAALQAFLAVLKRRSGDASCVWRMEYQRRGSIHFHLLCFKLPYWHWEEILETWKRITGQSVARIDVRLVKSRRGVMNYVSKYIAKVAKKGIKTFFIYAPYLHAVRRWRKGRFWGYHNKKALPLGEKVAGVLLVKEGIKRLSKAAWNIIGNDTRFGSISFHLFADHAISIAKRNIEAFGMFTDEWSWTRDVPDPTKQEYHPYTEQFSDADYEKDRLRALELWSRPRSARSVQPCTKDWLAKPSFLSQRSSGLPILSQT